MRIFTIMTVAGLGLATGAGCAGERAANSPASYQELKQQELEQERHEYIGETRQRLDAIEQDIQHLQAKLKHEKQFVDAQQQASWSNELFELKQEQGQLRDRLERAQSATPEEWEQMRGGIGTATDSLQAGVSKLSAEISQAFASDEGSAGAAANDMGQAPASDSALCRMGVSGARAEVERQDNGVTVTVTTQDSQSVPELQRRADELAKSTDSYGVKPARAESEAARTDANPPVDSSAPGKQGSATAKTPETIDVKVSAEKLDDGAKLTFTPKNGQVAPLLEGLERDAEQLGQGRCQPPAAVSMSAGSK